MAALTRVVIIASLLVCFSLLLLDVVEADQVQSSTNSQSSLPKTMNCGGACAARCQLSKRPRLCKRACGTCCFRCQCVPPGTSGNIDSCPCYANMTTHDNKRKCP